MVQLYTGERAWLGIDPGKGGGLVLIPSSQEDSVELEKMPQTTAELWTLIRRWSKVHDMFAIIEKVTGFAGEGHPGSRMFNFGCNYGQLLMALSAASVPFEEKSPGTWQGAFGLHRKKGEKDTPWKNRIKSKAQQLFPDSKIILATADAVLIAEYARRHDQKNGGLDAKNSN